MAVVYSYEAITDERGVHFRVRDAADNRVATCWQESNAQLVVKALNRCDPSELLAHMEVAWTCGHIAGHCCAQCFQHLARKATELQEKYDLALDQLASRDES